MTRPPRVVVDIEPIVIDGAGLDGAHVTELRAAIVDGLTDWLSGVRVESLASSVTPRASVTMAPAAGAGDARDLGTGIATAIRVAVDAGRESGL